MNTKIYYYLIGALIISIIGVLAFQNIPSQTQDTNIPVVIDTGTIVNTGSADSGSLVTGNQNNPLVYTNTEYGFQLTLPEGWEGYKVFIYTGSTIESGVSISFALPTTSSGWLGVIDPNDDNNFIPGYTGQYKFITGYADMLMLNVWTHKGYQKIINTEDAMWTKDTREGATRAKSEKYFYTMNSWPQDLPVDISKKIKFGSYYEGIKNSFKIL